MRRRKEGRKVKRSRKGGGNGTLNATLYEAATYQVLFC